MSAISAYQRGEASRQMRSAQGGLQKLDDLLSGPAPARPDASHATQYVIQRVPRRGEAFVESSLERGRSSMVAERVQAELRAKTIEAAAHENRSLADRMIDQVHASGDPNFVFPGAGRRDAAVAVATSVRQDIIGALHVLTRGEPSYPPHLAETAGRLEQAANRLGAALDGASRSTDWSVAEQLLGPAHEAAGLVNDVRKYMHAP